MTLKKSKQLKLEAIQMAGTKSGKRTTVAKAVLP